MSFSLFCGDFGVEQAKMLDLSLAFCYNIYIDIILDIILLFVLCVT